MPRIVGKIRRMHSVEVEDLKFLRRHTSRRVKITVPGPFTMTQQAQNDFYADEADAAMDYAAAVNEEIKDLFAAGADVVQIDEPYLQARPEKARQYGLTALNRALEGVTGTTAVHICFGYAAIIHARPTGYSFLAELAECRCAQISIETAQSKLDCSVLADAARQAHHGRAHRPVRHDGRDRRDGRRAHPARAAVRARPKRHRRARLRHEVSAARVAFGKMQAMVEGRDNPAAGVLEKRLHRARDTGGVEALISHLLPQAAAAFRWAPMWLYRPLKPACSR